ncbi:NAD(P)H-dependent flavin oxidoreductase [Crocinitomix catalasitica]|uniref:NAD(P)H-dependent flavin oxidoreductase n=1 Tax=Crocinitomix catalasitica TaxID=184607 RepID=UPI0005648129|nr:nitronate monooxygenase [Crocinitomix catalasitica]
MTENRITTLFNIKYPLIQAGMIWCSGWELASAVSNAGGLGIIGSGSMYPDVLRLHIEKCKKATDQPFAVNLPMLYPSIEEHIATIIELKVPIVFTSAGNPKTWTSKLKEAGITVVHVVSSLKFALKSQDAGVDAVVVEGFEAGGHNGIDETTTLTLVPAVAEKIDIPVIAAGGIGSGKAMLATMILGADGVQVGSRFITSVESSAHINFKNRVVETGDGGTRLTLKELTPVRLIQNEFYQKVQAAYAEGADKEKLADILGRGRAKKGMFEGDMIEGELEVGQVASTIHEIKPAAEIVAEMMQEFNAAVEEIKRDKFNF